MNVKLSSDWFWQRVKTFAGQREENESKRADRQRRSAGQLIVASVRSFQSPKIRFVLVEQRALLRDSFVARLGAETDLDVEAVSSLEELAQLAASDKVDVAILSGGAGESTASVCAALRALRTLGPEVPCVVLSGSEDPNKVSAALGAGAKGYISVSMPFAVVLAALRVVAAGGTFAPADCLKSAPENAKQASQAKAEALFTARQAAVVDALSKGMANKTIAHELNLRESTVKVHVRKIMRKLHATNRTQAAFLARELKDREADSDAMQGES